MTPALHDRAYAYLSASEVYAILQLRASVFVVEQACAYLDPDGRDVEPTTRHIWFEDDAEIVAVARVLDEGTARRIGRIATRADHRGRGLAGRLIDHVLATARGPWQLDAQAHLADWYRGFGFATAGPEYVEDGIPHVPMRRGEERN